MQAPCVLTLKEILRLLAQTWVRALPILQKKNMFHQGNRSSLHLLPLYRKERRRSNRRPLGASLDPLAMITGFTIVSGNAARGLDGRMVTGASCTSRTGSFRQDK